MTLGNVLGIVQIRHTINSNTQNTIVQVPWLITVDVAPHHEEVEDYLCGAEQLARDWTCENFARICHIVHVCVGDEASVGYENAKACDKDDASVDV